MVKRANPFNIKCRLNLKIKTYYNNLQDKRKIGVYIILQYVYVFYFSVRLKKILTDRLEKKNA